MRSFGRKYTSNARNCALAYEAVLAYNFIYVEHAACVMQTGIERKTGMLTGIGAIRQDGKQGNNEKQG